MQTHSLPLAATASALRLGELELLDHIDVLLERIERVEPRVHALIPEPDRSQRLRREAEALAERYPDPDERPPLFGVTVGVKDIFAVDGFETRAGSRLPAELFQAPEAEAVARLKRAGALIVGKSVTTEFAYFEPGPTRNPHNLEHTPGGSSSGSAAGVAAGLFALALGTQTIGSVIRPAAFCGIVGFKPSFDRIPTRGLLYFARSFDHVGLFTQDLAGAELAASVLCDRWQSEQAQAVSQTYPTLAVPEGPYLESASPEGREAFEASIRRLEDRGVIVQRIAAFPNYAELDRRHRRLMAAEGAQEHRDWYDQHSDLYSEHMHGIMKLAREVDEDEIQRERAAQLDLRRSLHGLLADHEADLWIAPAAPGTAPRGIESTGNPIMNLPWTNSGLPALTLPSGRGEGNLPLGIQLIAPFGQDEALFAYASRIEPLLAP